MTTVNTLREMIVRDLAWPGSPHELTDDYPLIDNEVIDSLGIHQLVAYVEEHYGIEVEDDDLVPDNFETLAAIARLVESKRGS